MGDSTRTGASADIDVTETAVVRARKEFWSRMTGKVGLIATVLCAAGINAAASGFLADPKHTVKAKALVAGGGVVAGALLAAGIVFAVLAAAVAPREQRDAARARIGSQQVEFRRSLRR